MTLTDHRTHQSHNHEHGPACGHAAVTHDGHTDYLHDGHVHTEHDGHYDECTVTHAAHAPDEAHVNHQHGTDCGHEAVAHDDHNDYIHDGHRHAAHEGHYDEH